MNKLSRCDIVTTQSNKQYMVLEHRDCRNKETGGYMRVLNCNQKIDSIMGCDIIPEKTIPASDALQIIKAKFWGE